VYDTLFVGDLPPSVTSERLKELFEEHVPEAKGGMSRVRIMGAQGYGFVSFKDPLAAQSVLARVGEGSTGPPITVDGHTLRIARAEGSMRGWKRGPAIVRSLPGSGPGAEGGEGYSSGAGAGSGRGRWPAATPGGRASPAAVAAVAHMAAYAMMYAQGTAGGASGTAAANGGSRHVLSYDDL